MYWAAVWQNVFWNRRIRAVYDLPGDTRARADDPAAGLTVDKTGALLLRGRQPGHDCRTWSPPTTTPSTARSSPREDQHNTDRLGLNLWQVAAPARLATITTGVEQYGDIDQDAGATLHVYGCKSGKFSLVLLVKEPQTDRIYLERAARLEADVHGHPDVVPEIPVSPTAGRRATASACSR